MKRFTIGILLLLQTLFLFAQKEKSYVYKGNKLYAEQKYKEAEANYRKSVEKKAQSVEGNFNLGDALYKQKQYDKAAEQFSKIAASPAGKAEKAKAYHNLGNSLLQSKKIEESIEAYKKALMNNPKDDETRYNLAYAQELLKKQQNDQNKKDQDKKNQNKDQDKKNQDQKNKDDKNQDQKDGKDQQKKDQDNKNGQDQQKKQGDHQPGRLSKEDAQRILDAMNNDEQRTQQKVKNQKAKAGSARITKDW